MSTHSLLLPSSLLCRSVEVFDAGRGVWELLPQQLASERKYCAAAALGGRLLVLGGMNEARSRLASVEGYDPREGRWSQLTSMTVRLTAGMRSQSDSCSVNVTYGI
jgi:N-acetylneuraminic acid mutarotase